MVTLDQAIKVRNKILEKTVERRYLEHTDLENKKNRLYGITKHGGSLHPEKSRPKKLEHDRFMGRLATVSGASLHNRTNCKKT